MVEGEVGEPSRHGEHLTARLPLQPKPSRIPTSLGRGAEVVAAGGAYLASSCARDEDSARWALAWASNSLAFFSNVSTASAPAGQRSGGPACLASWISALARIAGSPPCRPF